MSVVGQAFKCYGRTLYHYTRADCETSANVLRNSVLLVLFCCCVRHAFSSWSLPTVSQYFRNDFAGNSSLAVERTPSTWGRCGFKSWLQRVPLVWMMSTTCVNDVVWRQNVFSVKLLHFAGSNNVWMMFERCLHDVHCHFDAVFIFCSFWFILMLFLLSK